VAGSPNHFQLLGFPVHVRPGFWIFMLLVVFAQGPHFGVPFAIFLAVFTLIHELGHAFAARYCDCRAEIALDFMAGYAAYTPTHELSKAERALISFAGPGIQIALGGAAYLAIRGSFALPEYGNAVQHAVLWAGPLIGALNLMPLLPFDGGHLAQIAVETVAPRRAHFTRGHAHDVWMPVPREPVPGKAGSRFWPKAFWNRCKSSPDITRWTSSAPP